MEMVICLEPTTQAINLRHPPPVSREGFRPTNPIEYGELRARAIEQTCSSQCSHLRLLVHGQNSRYLYR